jgi:ABC-type Mn2+/Zn2+ transport system permease subunit
VAIPFLPMFVVGAALLALWIDTRRPSLAPDALAHRVLAAAGSLLALQLLPVFTGSEAALYATVFAFLLPALVWAFLSAVWLLRALREVQFGH